ncbi:hypothetical protein GQX73_g95 [Xylaria multiplex]|uniref:Uncharacterized protein n=1 Tax=Xylaria multiplex TaxID=323545 RepID=A0A7C8N1P1_9PEZI|nr:hypothetical protein GQX73_g95 [Xylaria multiplex]
MYSKISAVAIVGLLAAGAMAQSSTPATTPTTTVSTSSTGSSSSSAVPSSSTTPSSSPSVTVTPSTSVVSSSSLVTSKSTAAPVWSFFNVTVTSVVVVQRLTTLCKEATTLTFNDCVYPATKGQVITVTNCPCTVTTTVPTISSSLCPPGVTPPAIALPPPVEIAPAPKVTPTVNVPLPVPSSKDVPTATPSYIQVGSAPSSGSGNINGLIIAAAAVVLGL